MANLNHDSDQGVILSQRLADGVPSPRFIGAQSRRGWSRPRKGQSRAERENQLKGGKKSSIANARRDLTLMFIFTRLQVTMAREISIYTSESQPKASLLRHLHPDAR